jgi:WD40 repeat protein
VETANLDPIAIAEVEAGETRQRESQLHRDEILAARFDASGTRVITASRDHTAKVFGIDPNTMSIRKIASINTGLRDSSELNEGTDFLAMSAQSDTSGKRLFVGSADSTIRIWDVDSGIELGSLTGTGLNNAFALSRDGRYLLSGSSRPDAKAILWNVASDLDQPIAVHRLGGHDQAVTAFAISSDGGILVTGDRSGRCQVWDNASGMRVGEPIDRFRGFRINELAISSDDASLWVATDIGQLTEIDLISRERRRQLEHDGFVTSFSLSPNGDRAVTVSTLTSTKSMVTSATLWDLRTGNRQPLGRVEAELDQTGQSTGSQARINSARFSRDGSRVVICRQGIGGRVGQVTIEDLASSTNKTFGLPPQIGAPEVGLMLGTNRLITLNGEAAFRWSIEGMIHEKSYRPHAAVTNACFSPDDSIAATASRSIRLWDTRTGESIDKLENPHGGAITSLDFSNRVDTDGLVFASSGADGSARLWTWKDRETGFRERRELGNGATAIRLVRFTPDGRNVMIAGENGMLQVSSLDDPAATSIRTLPEGLSATCAAFSSDGRFLAVGVTDKSAWLFDLNPDAATKPRVMRGHADRIESICVLEDPSDQIRVLTASRDKSARVWDPKLAGQEAASDGSSPTIPGREILSLRRHTQGVTAIDCTSDGELVMTAARDGRVMLWPAKLP